MDVEKHDSRANDVILAQVEPENSRNSVEGMVVETVIVIETEEKAYHSRENIDSGVASSDSDRDEQQTNENSSNSSFEVLVETQVAINPSEVQSIRGEDDTALNAKVGALGLSKSSSEESKKKGCETEKRSCVVDINCGGAKSCSSKWDGESICRICHLSSDQSPDRRTTATSVSDLIQLGCGCKDDLGISHYQCAEAWFKLKGNRVCEICGETAKNVTGVGDIRFMEEWNERFSLSASNSSERSRGCWRGQPFCNFLMACLVIAFVLPWFLRVNMF